LHGFPAILPVNVVGPGIFEAVSQCN
jgi:hypothetical protein